MKEINPEDSPMLAYLESLKTAALQELDDHYRQRLAPEHFCQTCGQRLRPKKDRISFLPDYLRRIK